MKSIKLFFFVFLAYTFQTAAAEPAVMSQVKKLYNPNATIQTQFNLETFWSVREKTDHKSGKLYLAPQNKFRVEFDNETYVSNGQTYWQYNKKTAQVIIDKVSNIDVSTLPSQLLQKYLSQYTYTEKEKTSTETVVEWNRPQEEKVSSKSIRVWINSTSGVISKIQITDQNDNVNTYTFQKTVFGKKVPKGVFEFEVPKNAQVIKNNE